MTLKPRQCELCGRETTDWTISIVDDADGRTTVLWCRDPEDCLQAHAAARAVTLGHA